MEQTIEYLVVVVLAVWSWIQQHQINQMCKNCPLVVKKVEDANSGLFQQKN